MDTDHPGDALGCCPPTSPMGCTFSKALLSRAASCSRSVRRNVGETIEVACTSPVAHANCSTLLAMLRERSRFALKLPSPQQRLTHAQALRLQCGGAAALAQAGASMGGEASKTDIHALVMHLHDAHGSFAELPWATLVPQLVAWAPRRRRS